MRQGRIGNEKLEWNCIWQIKKYHGDIDLCKGPAARQEFLDSRTPFETIEGEGNCLLNTGINEIWDLVVGIAAQADHVFDETDSTVGVGDGDIGASATQTDLQAAVNKTYKAMEAGFPTSTAQKITFKSIFGSSDANYAWEEWVVRHAVSEICLNRKAEPLGTKVAGSTWTVEVGITLS